MMVFNKPEEAAKLKLKIVGNYIGLDIKDIPKNMSIDDMMSLIREKGIELIDNEQ